MVNYYLYELFALLIRKFYRATFSKIYKMFINASRCYFKIIVNKKMWSKCLKRSFSRLTGKTKICIIGAGPAGFYAAQHLGKKLENSQIDIIEKLPVPFGLVRFGVAPDHPEVKNVISTFTRTAENPNINFYGNIQLGKDISLSELKEFYHIILLTYGAEENRNLNIEGENLENVISARKIVGWYNGLPSDKNLKINLNCETAAIIGQGNVAIDVARILLTPIEELKKTDITQFALDQLAASKLKRIFLIGRRGPLQAAFTIKELREMFKLNNCNTLWRKEDFNNIDDKLVENLPRPKKRITELMLKSVNNIEEKCSRNKIFNPIFYRSPLRILGKKCAEKLELGITELNKDDTTTAQLTKEKELLECELIISSIGYKSIQVDNNIQFFDHSKGIIKNFNGKIDENGLYTSGWLATGPAGVILNTMSTSFGVAEQIIQDIHHKYNNVIHNNNKLGSNGIKNILSQKNIQIVEWKDWKKIDEYEKKQGEKLGKPREKIVDIEEMLKVINSS